MIVMLMQTKNYSAEKVQLNYKDFPLTIFRLWISSYQIALKPTCNKVIP
jgi:hypothetical protein